MKNISRVVLATSLLATVSTASQAQQSPSLKAQAKAQTILEKAIKASGGFDSLAKVRASKTTLSTQTARVGQGPKADSEITLGQPAKTIAYRSGGRLAIENFANNGNLTFRYVSEAGQDWAYLTGQNAVATVDPLAAAGVLDRVKTSAHVLLKASERSAQLRYIGKHKEGKDRFEMLSYADALGRQQVLYFNTKSGLLSKIESLTAHQQWGDITTTISYSDYKDVGGVTFAHQTTSQQGEAIVQKTTVDSIEIGNNIDETLFTKPEDAGENPPINAATNTPRELTLEALSDGIYYIENAAQGYNVIAVDYSDGILVLETPQSTQSTRDVIAALDKKFPNKPIKWAVPTHHHFDHSGGIYGYLEAGVPILTTKGNVKFVQEIGKTSRKIGKHSGVSGKVVVDTFDGNKVIGEGKKKVELYNVGPNPHAEEIIVAYIPSIKSLFVADIYSYRGAVNPANANQLAFAEKLEEMNLDIDTFIGVHGQKATAKQFWDSVKLGREQSENAGD
jgi:hypothetical protein